MGVAPLVGQATREAVLLTEIADMNADLATWLALPLIEGSADWATLACLVHN